MSDHPIDELPADVVELLRREASAYTEDDELKRTVWRRVETSVALALPAEAGHHVSNVAVRSLGATTVAWIALGAFAAGVGVGSLGRRPSPIAFPIASSTVAVASSAPAGSAEPSTALTEATPSIVPTAAPIVGTEPSTHHEDASRDLVRERERLDFARSALDHGDPDEAFPALEYHAKKWPKGYLAEEREVIWIQALAKAGRWEEAQKKASLFRLAYPKSVFEGAVDAAVGPANGPSFVTDSGTP